MLGGMWSVAFTDVIQFVLMLGGALILFPLAMQEVGWWPGLQESLNSGQLELVKQTGTYNWKFILAIFLLGIEWACVDQGLLQRSFGAENTKSVARGLVLAAIITTPFALLWSIPGLTASIILPGLENPDTAIPLLITKLVPNIVLGFIVVGLISSQFSTISGNLNGVATIFTCDIYENIINKKAEQKQVLFIARLVTICVGVLMIVFAYVVPMLGGAVEAYLTIIAIMDMPLFVIAIVYGLLVKRINWQGAIAGYLTASIVGAIGKFYMGYDFNSTTFITAFVALAVTPIVSLLTKKNENNSIEKIWRARKTSDEEIKSNDVYNILPKTFKGKLSLGVLLLGFTIFLTAIFLGSGGSSIASILAISGMVIYFIGGLIRAYTN